MTSLDHRATPNRMQRSLGLKLKQLRGGWCLSLTLLSVNQKNLHDALRTTVSENFTYRKLAVTSM
ncbi:MAG: hypothetical protein CMM01_08775 [Rhodopirellula sp.]|nr:hypothetical protein [Rhodopirellula sp.]